MQIDYEKLKIAHDIIKRNADYYFNASFFDGDVIFEIYKRIPDVFSDVTNNVDDLIAKLKELTQHEEPKPKYEVGQTLWFIDCDHTINSILIDEIDYCHPDLFYYKDKRGDFISDRDKPYPSREAVIDAQIEYWKCLKNEEKTTGSDDMSMTNQSFDSCQHCGEFYK